MRHFLLSEQDLDEIIWDIEYCLWQLTERIRDKFIHEENRANEYWNLDEEECQRQKNKSAEEKEVEF